MAEAIFPLISALVACALCVMVLLSRQRQRDLQKSSAALIGRRLLKPRAPADCPACRRQCAHAASPPVQPSSVPPWRDLRHRRGAPHASPPTGLPVPTRLPLVWHHRRPRPRPRRRRHARHARADSDVSLASLQLALCSPARACMSAGSARSACRISTAMNSARGCAIERTCCGGGSSLIR